MHARRLIPLLAVLTALIAAPAASAKEIESVQACGSDDCVTTHDRAILQGLTDGGNPTVPPRAPDGAIRLTATVVEKPGGKPVGKFISWWVPSLRLLVVEDGTWMPPSANAVEALDGLGLEPLPASAMGSAAAYTPSPAPPAPAAADDAGGAPAWLLVLAGLALAAALVAAALFAQRPPRRSVPT